MNASFVIDALGGTLAVARMFRIKPPSVSGWRKNGIPAARMQLIEVVRPDVLQDGPIQRRKRPAKKAVA